MASMNEVYEWNQRTEERTKERYLLKKWVLRNKHNFSTTIWHLSTSTVLLAPHNKLDHARWDDDDSGEQVEQTMSKYKHQSSAIKI